MTIGSVTFEAGGARGRRAQRAKATIGVANQGLAAALHGLTLGAAIDALLIEGAWVERADHAGGALGVGFAQAQADP